jgi:integrase
MKLTQASAAKAKLPAGKSEHIFWDDALRGFGLRLRDSGSRNWIVQYKILAKHRRITLGSTAMLTADQARNGWKDSDGTEHHGAAQILANAKHGHDEANRTAVRKAEAAHTFGAVIEDFIEQQAAHVRPSSLEKIALYLRSHWKPLHGLSLASISRADVATTARAIAKRSGPVAADRARSALSSFFGWAMGEGLCQHNPVVGTNKAGPAVSRDRVLSGAETVAIWNAAKAGDFGKIVRLLFLTGCRRTEIGGLRPSEIALGDSLISLPGKRTKNGLPHDVSLSAPARALVESLELKDRTHCFGRRDTGFSGWGKAKEELDAALPSIKKPWTLHDIRRTVATRMGDIGVQPHIVEAVLNHISGHKKGVAGTYNRSVYAREKQEALNAWATHLATLLAQADGVNVVAMRKRKDRT